MCKWSRLQMGSELLKPEHLKSRKMAAYIVKKHVKSGKNVLILKSLFFKWSGSRNYLIEIAIARPFKTRPLEIRSSKSLDFEW